MTPYRRLRSEALDDKVLYRSQLVNLDDESAMEFYEKVLPLLNMSGQDVLDAMNPDVVEGDSSRLLAIKRVNPEQAPKIQPNYFITLSIDEIGAHGSPVLFGFVRASSLLELDPRQAVHIFGNVQYGFHDFINGGGMVEDLGSEVDLPAGYLLTQKVGSTMRYTVDDVYGFHKPAVEIKMENTQMMPEEETPSNSDAPKP